ncbi:MAG: ABC transporter ATP-binding protein [Firmicutes bacterium]|nr:ABC transporter ATP-binding protein [Bacillota bacterium]
MAIVDISDLTMDYRGNIVLDHLDLTLEEGHIVGLLGSNGVGKTTLLKILAGLEMNYEGHVKIAGSAPGAWTKDIVSFQPDHLPLPKDLTAAAAIRIYKRFYEDFDESKAFYMLEQFKLEAERKIREMSKGMRDKLQITLTLSRKAKLYLLDEPIGGVDPAAKQSVIEGILDGFDPNATMLLSTHMVRDIEPIIDTAVFLGDGKVVMQDDTDALRAWYHGDLEDIFREVYGV